MWRKLGEWILRYRLPLLVFIVVSTVVMLYFASKVQMSYEFAKAIPTNNPKFQEYLSFKKQFGEDGNLLAIGFQSDHLFEVNTFNQYINLHHSLKNISGVEDVISIASAINLRKDSATEKLVPQPIFQSRMALQEELDSCKAIFFNLPFYRGILYNPETQVYLVGVKVKKEVLNSKQREVVVPEIEALALAFGKQANLDIKLSGLPLIRSNISTRIANEMKLFVLGSIVFSAIILFIFFRSFGAMLLSLLVVIMGVIWSLGTISLFNYKLTVLTGLIPPLIVVIGIPNCIYFLNKYHTSWLATLNKKQALVEMVEKMGVITLFCNITAAIGFAVFALTKSSVLKEFGVVAGINIMVIFLISFILLPAALCYLPAPKARHIHYLDNKWLSAMLTRIELWVFNHKKAIIGISAVVVAFSIAGILKLRSEGFIVDDLPKTDKIYTDLKFFEHHFKGIMPLEILIDAKRKNGFVGMRALSIFEKVDSFSQYIAHQPEMARPLSLAEGLKFAKQAFYDGDSNNYAMPNAFDGAFVSDYLRGKKDSGESKSTFQRLMSAFMDSNRQVTRISVTMADVGSSRLPNVLDTLKNRAYTYFDSTKYEVRFTGTSITFLEGSRYIINGLKESIIWAFLLIALCMLYLFKSFRILLCSLIPNLIPLLFTAGIMGWTGIPLKPSTVLIFSVALGIAIDVTIRFLVNYKQELPYKNGQVRETVLQTIRQTGISILYTSMVLVAGFVIFMFSGFGGTKALGWLTSVTLFSATLTNLVLLPVLLLITSTDKRQSQKSSVVD